MNKFSKAGVIPQKKTIRANAPLQGKSFVFTGTLENMGRNEAKMLVENLGGTIHSSITKTRLMLLPEANPGLNWKRRNHLALKLSVKKNF